MLFTNESFSSALAIKMALVELLYNRKIIDGLVTMDFLCSTDWLSLIDLQFI